MSESINSTEQVQLTTVGKLNSKTEITHET